MKSTIVLLSTLISFSIAKAQTAGNWPLNANLNGTAGAHLSVSAVSLGSSIPASSFNGGSEWYGEGGWPSGTIDANAYVQFTLTANAGRYLVLNTVTLIQRRSNTGTPTGSGPTSWSLRSSLDNYTTDITTGSMTHNYATYTVALPAAFQAIPSGVTFRIYGYSTIVNSGGTSRMVLDNISVQGQSISGVLAEQSISLSAHAGDEKHIALHWDAIGFSDGTAFTVQRSFNGVDFTSIFHTERAMQYDDVIAPVTVFYRVMAGLPDGSTYYSPIVSVKEEEKDGAVIKGVAAQGSVVKTFLHLKGTGVYQVSIWSQDGRPLVRRTVSGQAGDVQSDIAFSYPHGVYILTLSKGGEMSSRVFVN